MTNMLSDSDPATTFLTGIQRKIGIIHLVVDGFIPTEEQQWTNVIRRTGKYLKRIAAIHGRRGNVVQKETDVQKAQQPEGHGRTCPVKNGVGNRLKCLISMLTRILVLLVWLTLPIRDIKGTANIFDLVADLNLCTIADYTATNVILQSINKLFLDFIPSTLIW
jgi:hypothetical protein